MYHFILRIVKISLRIFFKRIHVDGRDLIPREGPLIIVANHPNTFMDPMIVASLVKQQVGFIANAGIFVNRFVSGIFGYFHVIPIFRKKDVKEGETPDNTATFLKCHEYLRGGGTLLVFPEGSSYYELRLREIKTGTARIALSFEQLYGFRGGLRILPVSLDYSDAIQFRSMVSVTVGEPIGLEDYREIYQADPQAAVRQLTETIRKEFASNLPQTSGKEQEEYLIRAHKFYTAYHEPDADLHEDASRSLTLRKELSAALHHTQKNHPAIYNEIGSMLEQYFRELSKYGLTTGFFAEEFQKQPKGLVLANYIFKLIALFHVYFFGLITNYLPYIMPSKVYEISKLDPSYKAPLQLVTGLITFPLFYSINGWLFAKYVSNNAFYICCFTAAVALAGYGAMYYYTEARRFKRVLRYFMIDNLSKRNLMTLKSSISEKIRDAGTRLGI